MNDLIPWHQFDAELTLVRHLVHDPPWAHTDDRGLRAAFRRWTPADVEPSVEMLAALWPRVPAGGWKGLDEPGLERAVRHAALVLHLRALGLDPGEPGTPTTNLGAAARAASVAEGRFARLMNTPAPARLEALGRLFRRLRTARVHLHLTAPKPEDGETDRRSTLATLKDLRRDDLAALLAFLFTDDPKPAVSRWAAGYYRTSDQPETAATETA
ncbi:hypothetical protein AWN76_012490 [Rhodothermaceae bacterium RA]|nr:hypothetical protein AWN76_012490 [Rhodothermaceae bacterium RA]